MIPATPAVSKSAPIHIRPRGPRLDPRALRAFIEQCEQALTTSTDAIVIDLSAVETIDSVAVTALVGVQRKAGRDRRVALAGLSSAVQLVARVCHLHEIFEIYVNAEAATRALSR